MAGLRKKRHSMKRTLLRRAVRTESTDVDRSALYDVPQTRSSPQAKGITVLTSFNKSAHLGHIIQRNPVNNVDSSMEPGGARRLSRRHPEAGLQNLLTKTRLKSCEQRSPAGNVTDRKSNPRRNIAKDNRSGDSLKARGSRASRASFLSYPSSWNLDIPRTEKSEEELKNALSLSEVHNCDLLKRTPYDHRLNEPVAQRRPKIDSSVQCIIPHKTRKPSILRRTKATVRNVAQTQTSSLRVSLAPKQRVQKIRTKPGDAHRAKRNETYPTGILRMDKQLELAVGQLNLPPRVYSGKSQSRSASVISTAFNNRQFAPKTLPVFGPGRNRTGTKMAGGQNYGGYTPSEGSRDSVKDVQRQSTERFNRIEQISQPPPVSDRQFEDYQNSPSVCECECECETESELDSDSEFRSDDPNEGKSMSDQRVWRKSKNVMEVAIVAETDSYEQQPQNVRQQAPFSSCACQCAICSCATTQTVARRVRTDGQDDNTSSKSRQMMLTNGRGIASASNLKGTAGVTRAVVKSPKGPISNSSPTSKGRQENAAKNLRAKETRSGETPTSQPRTPKAVSTGKQNQAANSLPNYSCPCNCHYCLNPYQFQPAETNPYVQIFCECPCPSYQVSSSQSPNSAKNYAASSKSKPIGSTARQRSSPRSREPGVGCPNDGQGNCVPSCRGSCKAARHTSTTDLPRKRPVTDAAKNARGNSIDRTNDNNASDSFCKCDDNGTQTSTQNWHNYADYSENFFGGQSKCDCNPCPTENAQVQCDGKCPNCGVDIKAFERNSQAANDANKPSEREDASMHRTSNMSIETAAAPKKAASKESIKQANAKNPKNNNNSKYKPSPSKIDEYLRNECRCCEVILNKKRDNLNEQQKEKEKKEEQQRQQQQQEQQQQEQQEQQQQEQQQQEQQQQPEEQQQQEEQQYNQNKGCNLETCIKQCGKCKIIPAKTKEGDATVNLVVDDNCNVNQIIEILQETVAQLEQQKKKQGRTVTNPIVAQGQVDANSERMHETGPRTPTNSSYMDEHMTMAYGPTVPYDCCQNHCCDNLDCLGMGSYGNEYFQDQSDNYMPYNAYPEYNQYPQPINTRQSSQKKGPFVATPTGTRKTAAVHILTQMDYDYPQTGRGLLTQQNVQSTGYTNGQPAITTFENQDNDQCTCCPGKNQLREIASNAADVRPRSGSSYPFEWDSKFSLSANAKRKMLQKMKVTKSFIEIYDMAMALKKNSARRKKKIVDENMNNHSVEFPGTNIYSGSKQESINRVIDPRRKNAMQSYPTTLYKDHDNVDNPNPRQNQKIEELKGESPHQDCNVYGYSFKSLRHQHEQPETKDRTKKHVKPELNSSDSECYERRDVFLKQRKSSTYEQLNQFRKQQVQTKHGSYRGRRTKNSQIERKLSDDKYSNERRYIRKKPSETSAVDTSTACCRKQNPKKNVEPSQNQEPIYAKLKDLLSQCIGVNSSKLIGHLPYHKSNSLKGGKEDALLNLESNLFGKTNKEQKISKSKSNQSICKGKKREVRDKDKVNSAGEDKNYSKPTQYRPRSRISKIENQEVSLSKYSNDAKAKYLTSKIILDVGKYLRRDRKGIEVSDHSEMRKLKSIGSLYTENRSKREKRESDNFESSKSKLKSKRSEEKRHDEGSDHTESKKFKSYSNLSLHKRERKDRIKEVTHPEQIKRQISKTFSLLSGINEIKKEDKNTVQCPEIQFIEETQREPKLKATSSGLLVSYHSKPKDNKAPIPPRKPGKNAESKSSDFSSYKRRKRRHVVSQKQSNCDDIKVLYDSSYKFSKYSYGDGDTNTDCESLQTQPSEGPNNFFCMLGTRDKITGRHRYSH